ncbi:hypothetical protein GCM10010967_50570 [Dyadobacter beijingensis]|uniref:DUF2911 domain-containing protein n=1 Tax=Dyadobacter beijingensis TaxID=365489 RepID=A0ABQ2IIG0_9BACT|nr:DUF2911 domain-containing protein [Dyadobacter beijingensis]GGN08727.1 hypothetical protein GCM10010967_50570 [Dyadobacter beijingensis]
MRKVLLIVFALVAVASAGFWGVRKYTKSFSPEAVAETTENGVKVHVTYSQPGKKGRMIFGREQDKALLPYGKVWRTGANEATLIEFPEDVIMGGKPVKAGTYSLFSVPGQSSWKIILNSETGQWGTEYNDGKNVMNVEVPIRIRPSVQELFHIYFEPIPNGVNMVLSWDQTEALVPFTHP